MVELVALLVIQYHDIIVIVVLHPCDIRIVLDDDTPGVFGAAAVADTADDQCQRRCGCEQCHIAHHRHDDVVRCDIVARVIVAVLRAMRRTARLGIGSCLHLAVLLVYFRLFVDQSITKQMPRQSLSQGSQQPNLRASQVVQVILQQHCFIVGLARTERHVCGQLQLRDANLLRSEQFHCLLVR